MFVGVSNLSATRARKCPFLGKTIWLSGVIMESIEINYNIRAIQFVSERERKRMDPAVGLIYAGDLK